MKFSSGFSELLVGHVGAKLKSCTEGYVKKTVSALSSFDAYCVEAGYVSGRLTEAVVSGWLSDQAEKGCCIEALCRTAIRQFALFLVENGKPAYVLPVRSQKAQPTETVFGSCLSGFIVGLLESKRARGFKYGLLNECGILRRIDAFCIDEGLEGEGLPRWIVEKWSERTSGEGAKSRSNRIVVIRQLAMYIVAHGGNAYVAEAAPVPHNPFPYVPNEEEIAALLVEIDSQKDRIPWASHTFPMLFRLLLASGLRIHEACSLKSGCLNLDTDGYCTIDIIDAKGHKDRRIYLSGDVLMLLKAYDERMSAMMPGREWFFPGIYRPMEEHVSPSTARARFSSARDVVYAGNNGRRPTVHSLRHAYIMMTIRRWREEGLDVEGMLPYLSKHLGHCSIQETFTYYDHYSPDYAHVRSDAEYFNAIVPEVRYEK
jgi:integrase